MDPQMIDSLPALAAFIDGLPDCKGEDQTLYMDLEGNNLSRNGTLSLITILVEPRHTVHLIDVTGLGTAAFDTASPGTRTLRQILESSSIVKVFFDIRNDSDALFGLFGVRVAGIEDLQLMELASRSYPRRYITGLAKCIEKDSTLSYSVKRDWKNGKDKGHKLFDPKLGGSYAVFDQRPLSADMMKYCAQDVIHMPGLRELYRARLCDAWWRKIEQATTARITLSHGHHFNGKGMHMTLAPPGWDSWKPTRAERHARTLFVRRPEPMAQCVSTTATTPSVQSTANDASLSDVLAGMSLTERATFATGS